MVISVYDKSGPSSFFVGDKEDISQVCVQLFVDADMLCMSVELLDSTG